MTTSIECCPRHVGKEYHKVDQGQQIGQAAFSIVKYNLSEALLQVHLNPTLFLTRLLIIRQDLQIFGLAAYLFHIHQNTSKKNILTG